MNNLNKFTRCNSEFFDKIIKDILNSDALSELIVTTWQYEDVYDAIYSVLVKYNRGV